jgi:hypothetical protein
MDKALRAYITTMTEQITAWEKHPETLPATALQHHVIKTQEFQHERLVHLLITLFFGCLFLGSLAALFILMTPLTTLLGTLLAIILLVTELFYIRYYYFLENGVQKLYAITDRLAKLHHIEGR